MQMRLLLNMYYINVIFQTLIKIYWISVFPAVLVSLTVCPHTFPQLCNKAFELLFLDLWGPAPVKSTSGFSYYLSIVDAASKYTWIFLLKQKSETLDIFKQFRELVKVQFQANILAVQTDCGGGGSEFRPFTRFLSELGIIHRVICPDTHHQNGSVERKHCHILQTGLTLMAQVLGTCFSYSCFSNKSLAYSYTSKSVTFHCSVRVRT